MKKSRGQAIGRPLLSVLSVVTVILAVSLLSCPAVAGESSGTALPAVPRIELVGPQRVELGPCLCTQEKGYDFQVKNVGAAPLSLSVAKLTCTCAFCDVPKEPIPPGQVGIVRMGYRPDQKGRMRDGEQLLGACLSTNDPAMPLLDLMANAHYYSLVSLTPKTVVFPALNPGESRDLLLEVRCEQDTRLSSAGITPSSYTIVETGVKTTDKVRLYTYKITFTPDGKDRLVKGVLTFHTTSKLMPLVEVPVAGVTRTPETGPVYESPRAAARHAAPPSEAGNGAGMEHGLRTATGCCAARQTGKTQGANGAR